MARRLPKKEKRACIEVLVEETAKSLLLQGWRIKVEFPRKLSEPDRTAECSVRHEYKELTIWFDLVKIPDDQIQWTVIHEMLHAVLDPLAGIADEWAKGSADREERVRLATEAVNSALTSVLWREWFGKLSEDSANR